ncbi:hypothetical protein H1S01_03200 [Heliobacterium chlorum]|uniref:DUF2303 family protein n=1 Tax=Heliobacterium chlorum TaxID=2698 RepID=A0ABR7T0L7_HELCL|nr:hypothetical protein [Heliobacterium chlorum]MBC9783518.1 hypothetical protein [Heliobacterium chlorum]
MDNENVKVQINTGEAAEIRLVTVNEPPAYRYNGFNYNLESTESFINAVTSKGCTEGTVIFYHENGFNAVLDDRVKDRQKDTLAYGFKKSVLFKEWEDVFQRHQRQGFNQKEFVDFLKRRPADQVAGVEALIANASKMQFAKEVKGGHDINESGKTIRFEYHVNDVVVTAKLPTVIEAFIPVFNESPFVAKMEIELAIEWPDGGTPEIVLSCPKLPRYLEEARAAEVARLKEGLNDFLILAGQPTK